MDDDAPDTEGPVASALTGSTQVVVGAPESEAAPEPPPPQQLKIGIAPHPDGSMVTVVSPPPPPHPTIRPEILFDAARQGWQQTLAALVQLLQAPPTA